MTNSYTPSDARVGIVGTVGFSVFGVISRVKLVKKSERKGYF